MLQNRQKTTRFVKIFQQKSHEKEYLYAPFVVARLFNFGGLLTNGAYRYSFSLFSFLFFLEELKGKAQPKVAAAVGGRVADTIRHTAAPGVDDPAATTLHPAKPRRRPGGVRLGGRTIRTFPVLTPLPNVAAHVIKPQLIGRLRGHIVGGVATVVAKPGHTAQVAAAGILRLFTSVPAARGKLPLSLHGQAEMPARQLVQLFDKLLAIVPTHRLNRVLGAFKLRRVAAHDSLPKLLRHLRLANDNVT